MENKSRIIVGAAVILIFILAFVFFNSRSKAKEIPEEAKTAYKSLQKLKAATQTGVTFVNYNQLLIDAKTEVNMAEAKLPPVQSPEIIENGLDHASGRELESVHALLNHAMDSFQDAGKAWNFKINNTWRTFSGTDDGKAIQAKYHLKGDQMNPDMVTQTLWINANFDLNNLQSFIDKP